MQKGVAEYFGEFVLLSVNIVGRELNVSTDCWFLFESFRSPLNADVTSVLQIQVQKAAHTCNSCDASCCNDLRDGAHRFSRPREYTSRLMNFAGV